MLNKVNLAGFVVIIMALFLSGCGSKVQTLAYDQPIQENQSSVLIIPSPYTVTNFDGRQVNWTYSAGGISLSETAAAIRLPSGTHSFVYNYYWHDPGMVTYEHYSSGAVVQKRTPSRTVAFDGTVTINMEPGKRYRFDGRGISIDTTDNYDQLP